MISQITVFHAVLAYLAVLNIIASVVTLTDKIRAIRGKRRVSEKTLILLALLGGSLFEFITMILIRHKTQHSKFIIGLPLIILFQIIFLFLIYCKFITA